ncbi:hypothetical protein [Gemella massiliensis]|uniref:hypothetical protein n=1 Tax=Gemella massiliensis TaxID=1909670 RepID=UPI0009308323|nr:hypothetical protein [Gemella massiliensis]
MLKLENKKLYYVNGNKKVKICSNVELEEEDLTISEIIEELGLDIAFVPMKIKKVYFKERFGDDYIIYAEVNFELLINNNAVDKMIEDFEVGKTFSKSKFFEKYSKDDILEKVARNLDETNLFNKYIR